MKKIAIFASGSGSNAQKIIEYFAQSVDTKIEIIFSNKKDAYVLERARNFNIPSCVFSKDLFYNSDFVVEILENYQIDLIILAGFLWLVPQNIINKYYNRIINIHPALLPKYGGKGMYGMKVHEAVIKNHEKFSGITIHYLNERYDEGDIIFQAECAVETYDDANALANKIHALEYKYFPIVIADLLKKL